MAASESKDTIYVDIDDEITSIIEKVRGSDGKIVALVLPKRASVLQSIVNMKLLKRTAENAKKHLVLVTNEAGLMPLAGSVGLHVASTPTSKPLIPNTPDAVSDDTEDIDESFDVTDGNKIDAATSADDEEYDPKAAATTAVGDLAGSTAVGKIANSDIDEDLELDDAEDDTEPVAGAAAKKPKGNKKLHVPNFDSFRTKLLVGAGVLVLLIVAWIFAFVVLPKATVTIHTDTTSVTTNLNLTLDASAKTLDTTNKTVPAVSQAIPKSYSQQVAATGQQNNGTKAQGGIIMSAGSCSGTLPAGVDAGSAVTASSHTFVLQSAVSFTPTVSKGKCTFTGVDSSGNSTINVTALKGGTDYNLDSVSFNVSGRSDISASGTTSGGTDNITKVVAQADIDGAKAKITSQDTTTIKTDLQAGLQGKTLLPIASTFVAGDPQVTSSAQAGDAADTVTVTEVVNYTMLGVKQTDLQTLVDANVNSQIDKGKQAILDDGVAKATFTQQNPASATAAVVSLQAKSIAGPEIDTNSLKKQLVGKKTGDIRTVVKQTPGVTDVTVKYSPFWVSSVPKNVSKLTVVVDKANTGSQ